MNKQEMIKDLINISYDAWAAVIKYESCPQDQMTEVDMSAYSFIKQTYHNLWNVIDSLKHEQLPAYSED